MGVVESLTKSLAVKLASAFQIGEQNVHLLKQYSETNVRILTPPVEEHAQTHTHTHIYAGGKQWQTTPKTCPGCSVPEPYRSHDWALVPASPASKAEY